MKKSLFFLVLVFVLCTQLFANSATPTKSETLYQLGVCSTATKCNGEMHKLLVENYDVVQVISDCENGPSFIIKRIKVYPKTFESEKKRMQQDVNHEIRLTAEDVFSVYIRKYKCNNF